MIHLLANTESSGARNGRLGGLRSGGRKAEAACEKARRARAAQWAKNGALFGKVNPARIRQERPKPDWSRFEQYRQAVG